jgi:hypothetical protein
MSITYRDVFPIGSRVVVDAADPREGTDHEFNGRKGTIVEFCKCLAVEFDKPPKYWKNPALICMHNLRLDQ